MTSICSYFQSNLKFEQIREGLRGQAAESCVCTTFFTTEAKPCSQDPNCHCQLCKLRMKVFHSVMKLPRFGMQIPEAWVTFEKVLKSWHDKGIKHASVDEVNILHNMILDKTNDTDHIPDV